ncbi:MAG: isochorismatase family protein [Desulfovibrio sp.]|nr:isochorismatase family protein [Desulfovibrio sp.]
MSRCLLVVDPQLDFIEGALPVPGAKAAMENLADYLRASRSVYDVGIVTFDSHPINHCSFQENGGIWPRHCAAGSSGAEIWPDLLAALSQAAGRTLVLPKGNQADREEYSIFQNPQSAATLLAALEAGEVDEIDICGLAGNVCVLNTLGDGIRYVKGARFTVLGKFSPSLDGGKALHDFCARESVCVK